ncbi:dihydrofolate reductase [Cellulophaga baltica]|uniref:dihydrofolate reductase n=1 Tax=Cellulophaga TaxID=104264 RepID=UPI001C06CFEB|nr:MULTISPECIES: dihydrofolate reductase [Cellulophaga]MBU2995149.1 dihydrofolate reductase [Cellulophaga baltica]MDO6766544.1 dihydrofolate reductase [Cellulophaga sp. 1_MG-2023]
MKTITLIAAIAENNAIGKNNDLLWHLPDDFKRFKALTTGNPIIMGRKTFETFPKPLPHRKHIIITRDENYSTNFDNCVVVHNLDDALNEVKDANIIYIIGGGQIYTMGLEKATHMELTIVHDNFEADTFFPDFDKKNWKIIAEEYHPKDNNHIYDFTYITYERILEI